MPKRYLQLPNQELPFALDCTPEGDGLRISWTDPGTHEEQSHHIRVESPQSGEGWLRQGAALLPFYYHQDKNSLHLWIQGRSYQLALADLRPQRGSATGTGHPQSGSIKAPMPSTILQIKVKPGDTVVAQQALIIMESMKMEMTLSAPYAGSVAEVSCQEGQLVEMGTLLVKLEKAMEAEHADPSPAP